MNITGMPSYSKETVGLRQPIQIQDQQFRLVYVYPMLVADTLNRQELKKDLRKFLAISFLREIFVSNSLNIIQMASQIPAVNQNANNNVAQLIGNAVLSGKSSSLPQTMNLPNYQDTTTSYQLQNRVEVKTNQILKYLLTDPRTKKLSPEIEIITMNNLIDVPVIVGTKDFSVPTYPLIYVLIIAVAARIPLNTQSNVDKIIRILKNANEEDWVKILASINKTEEDLGFFAKWANENPEFKGKMQLRSWTKKIAKWFKISKEDKEEVEKKDLALKSNYDEPETNQLFNILKLIKNSLDDLSLNFKFVLNSDMLKRQVGLDLSNNTMETTVMKLSSNQYQIFMTMHDKFMELIGVPGSLLLSSVFNTLYPMPTNTPNVMAVGPGGQAQPAQNVYRLNFLELKEKHFDTGLNSKIQKLIFDTFVSEIKNSISQYSPKESQEKTKLLKAICQSMSQVDDLFSDTIEKFVTRDENVIKSINFDMNNLDSFTSSIHVFASKILSQNKRFENIFSQLVKNGSTILKIAQTQIYSSIEDFMSDIYTSSGDDYISAMSYHFGVNREEVKRTYIPQMTDTLFVIFYFFFLYRLQAAVCNYVDVLDIEIESKVNDVIDFPNYTLVINTDVLKAVYTAYIASNLKNLMSGDMRDVGTITSNHIKGMIKYLCKRTLIPSIIVFDEQKNEFYYQFMFMSAPEKITASAMSDFIKSNTNTKY